MFFPPLIKIPQITTEKIVPVMFSSFKNWPQNWYMLFMMALYILPSPATNVLIDEKWF